MTDDGTQRGVGFSRAALTPGTPLMLEIQSALVYFVCRKLEGTPFKGVQFEVNGSTVPVRLSSTLDWLLCNDVRETLASADMS